MNFQSIDQYCSACGGWFNEDNKHLERELVETNNGFKEIRFCPNCEPGTELKDAAEYGIQTPYQAEVCTVIAGEILMYEERINI